MDSFDLPQSLKDKLVEFDPSGHDSFDEFSSKTPKFSYLTFIKLSGNTFVLNNIPSNNEKCKNLNIALSKMLELEKFDDQEMITEKGTEKCCVWLIKKGKEEDVKKHLEMFVSAYVKG